MQRAPSGVKGEKTKGKGERNHMLYHRIMGVLVAIPLLLSTCAASGIKSRVTSYSASAAECGNSRGITASGVKVQKGMVAADWRVYPPGTILYCNDTEEVWVVGDRGGAVKGTHIDRFVATHREMRNYCGGKLAVSVLYKPEYSRHAAYSNVKKSFVVRQKVLSRGKELTSRGGFVRIKSEVNRMISQLEFERKNKEQQNGRIRTTNKNRKNGIRKNSNDDIDGFRNCSSENMRFRTWLKGQKCSSATTKDSQCYFGFYSIITYNWEEIFPNK